MSFIWYHVPTLQAWSPMTSIGIGWNHQSGLSSQTFKETKGGPSWNMPETHNEKQPDSFHDCYNFAITLRSQTVGLCWIVCMDLSRNLRKTRDMFPNQGLKPVKCAKSIHWIQIPQLQGSWPRAVSAMVWTRPRRSDGWLENSTCLVGTWLIQKSELSYRWGYPNSWMVHFMENHLQKGHTKFMEKSWKDMDYNGYSVYSWAINC